MYLEHKIVEEIMTYREDANFNIYSKIFTYGLKGIINSLFVLGKELWKNGTLKKHTYGNIVYLDVQFKATILKLYRYIGRHNLSGEQLSRLISAVCKASYRYFWHQFKDDNGILEKAEFIRTEKIYEECFMQQLIRFNAMMYYFHEKNYLVPFVIDRNSVEFKDNISFSAERKMCAILAEDLLLDFCFENFNGEINAYSSENVPTMSREFYKACEPFYQFIYNELFE